MKCNKCILFASLILGLLSINTYASFKDCPNLSSFKSGISFTAPGVVPTVMPYYDEFAGKADPYWHPDGKFWIVISNAVRISDGPSGEGRSYMSGVVVAGNAGDSRASVLSRAQNLIASASDQPNTGSVPAQYKENWDTGGYNYEMCLYSGFAGNQAEDMVAGTSIAEMMD